MQLRSFRLPEILFHEEILSWQKTLIPLWSATDANRRKVCHKKQKKMKLYSTLFLLFLSTTLFAHEQFVLDNRTAYCTLFLKDGKLIGTCEKSFFTPCSPLVFFVSTLLCECLWLRSKKSSLIEILVIFVWFVLIITTEC
jgi:hypothetical protein